MWPWNRPFGCIGPSLRTTCLRTNNRWMQNTVEYMLKRHWSTTVRQSSTARTNLRMSGTISYLNQFLAMTSKYSYDCHLSCHAYYWLSSYNYSCEQDDSQRISSDIIRNYQAKPVRPPEISRFHKQQSSNWARKFASGAFNCWCNFFWWIFWRAKTLFLLHHCRYDQIPYILSCRCFVKIVWLHRNGSSKLS